MGTTVFGTGTTHSAIHRIPTCPGLKVGIYEVKAFDASLLKWPKICQICFPEYPKVKVAHSRCAECGTSNIRPCQHNGGVLIYDPDHSRQGIRYAWPEDSHRFTLVNPLRCGLWSEVL